LTVEIGLIRQGRVCSKGDVEIVRDEKKSKTDRAIIMAVILSGLFWDLPKRNMMEAL
jgi:hypothetical protein